MVGVADLNKLAQRIVKQTTDSDQETPAQTSGRGGGRKGGRARAAKLTPEERSAIARRAAQARWAKRA